MSIGQSVATLATGGGVIVAIVLGTLSNRRASKASDRAEAAARTADSYTERVLEVLERIAANGGTGGGRAGQLPLRARWTLENHQGDLYRLTNDGGATAHHVEISAHESLPLAHVPPPMDVEPHQTLSFVAARSFATSDSTITVSWIDRDGQRRTWKYPLPPQGYRSARALG